MHLIFLALVFVEFSSTVWMCVAGLLIIGVGAWAAKNDFAQARGFDKMVALSNLCFAAPLAVFGAEHFSAARDIMRFVPRFVPWPLSWTYLVGVALLAASLSIATKIQVCWSGLLFGIMMFLFVAMMDLPAALRSHGDRFAWMYLLRELSFGGGGWILAGTAMGGVRGQVRYLITVGRIVVAIAAIVYGVEHFLHPLGLPGVPLERLMPAWIPARVLIGYVTGAFLLVAGGCFLLDQKTRRAAATYLGSWIVLLVVIVYGPVMIGGLADPSTALQVDGLNYFFDTLLFGGVILALASAMTPAKAEATTGMRASWQGNVEKVETGIKKA